MEAEEAGQEITDAVITRYRHLAFLTEKQLADIAGTSRNYIVKLEQTIYATPSHRVVNVLGDICYVSPYQIIREYEAEFKSKMTRIIPLDETARTKLLEQFSRHMDPRNTDYRHPHIILRTLLSVHYNIPKSQIKWAKTFNIHPSELNRYELGKTSTMPKSVSVALKHIDVPDEVMALLESRVSEEWLDND